MMAAFEAARLLRQVNLEARVGESEPGQQKEDR